MLPRTFPNDKQNCGRYLSVYHTQMTGLAMYHLGMHDHLKIGGFSDTQRGFSLNACVVSRYYMTFEYRNVYLCNLRHMVQVQTSSIVHVDLEPPRAWLSIRILSYSVADCNGTMRKPTNLLWKGIWKNRFHQIMWPLSLLFVSLMQWPLCIK